MTWYILWGLIFAIAVGTSTNLKNPWAAGIVCGCIWPLIASFLISDLIRLVEERL